MRVFFKDLDFFRACWQFEKRGLICLRVIGPGFKTKTWIDVAGHISKETTLSPTVIAQPLHWRSSQISLIVSTLSIICMTA